MKRILSLIIGLAFLFTASAFAQAPTGSVPGNPASAGPSGFVPAKPAPPGSGGFEPAKPAPSGAGGFVPAKPLPSDANAFRPAMPTPDAKMPALEKPASPGKESVSEGVTPAKIRERKAPKKAKKDKEAGK